MSLVDDQLHRPMASPMPMRARGIDLSLVIRSQILLRSLKWVNHPLGTTIVAPFFHFLAIKHIYPLRYGCKRKCLLIG
jgi:hypothetical protein